MELVKQTSSGLDYQHQSLEEENWFNNNNFQKIQKGIYTAIVDCQLIINEFYFRDAKLRKLRDGMSGFRSNRISPLERGWSGNKMPGRSIGAPDTIGEDKFEGFDSKVLELKTVFNMKGNMGRKRRLSVIVVTGNGKGLAGFALGKAVDSKAALRKAKNRAGQKLMYVELCDGHTVFHDFFCQFGKTKIFVEKKPEGYGLVCHKAIKTICEVIGIKNLYAKIEGAPCLQHIMKAFFLGLLKQKHHNQIAESKGLHLVEFRKEFGEFPKVVASPNKCRLDEDIKHDETMDYTQFVNDGKLVLKKKKFDPFFTKHRSWEIYLKKLEKRRNHFNVRKDMLVNYGEIKSFLTDKYPEAKPYKKVKEVEEEN